MASLHGGRVEVQSECGCGSTFTVNIPTGRDHLPAARIAPRAPATGVPARAYLAEAAYWTADHTNADEGRSEAADDAAREARRCRLAPTCSSSTTMRASAPTSHAYWDRVRR